MPDPSKEIKVILFDISGVLLDFRGSRGLFTMAGIEPTKDNIKDFRRRTGPWVKKLESGQCTLDEFAEGFLSEWPLRLGTDALYEELRTWPRALYPGAIELLESLAPRYTLGCLSNTNPLHWPIVRDEMGLGPLLEHQYVSYEIKSLKPEPNIYEHAIQDLGLPASAILFLDDREINIEAAREHGLEAHLTVGIDEVRAKLAELGVIKE